MTDPLIMMFTIIILLDLILLLYFITVRAGSDIRKTLQETWKDRIVTRIHRTLKDPTTPLGLMDRFVISFMKTTIIEELMKEKWLGTKEEDLKVLLQQWGYLSVLSKRIKSRKWWVQLQTLHVISVFHLTSFKPSVKQLVNHENPLVKTKAFRVLGTLGDIDDLRDMLSIIIEYDNERYRLNLMVNILEKLEFELDDENLSYLTKLYDESKDVLTKIVLIRLIASKFKQRSLPFLKDQLSHENNEVVIAAIKSMVRTDIYPRKELTRLMNSNHLGVQIVALKALTFTKNKNNIDLFEHYLLTSEHQWLKYYAGFGLAMLGTEGLDRLESLKNKEDGIIQTAKPYIHYFLQILKKEGYVWETLKRSLKNF